LGTLETASMEGWGLIAFHTDVNWISYFTTGGFRKF
jgi:hypothetical protein